MGINRFYAASEGMSDPPEIIESSNGELCYYEDVVLLEKEVGMLSKINKAQLSLTRSLRTQLSYYRGKDYSTSDARVKLLEDSLESEKAMNNILTKELEKGKII